MKIYVLLTNDEEAWNNITKAKNIVEAIEKLIEDEFDASYEIAEYIREGDIPSEISFYSEYCDDIDIIEDGEVISFNQSKRNLLDTANYFLERGFTERLYLRGGTEYLSHVDSTIGLIRKQCNLEPARHHLMFGDIKDEIYDDVIIEIGDKMVSKINKVETLKEVRV